MSAWTETVRPAIERCITGESDSWDLERILNGLLPNLDSDNPQEIAAYHGAMLHAWDANYAMDRVLDSDAVVDELRTRLVGVLACFDAGAHCYESWEHDRSYNVCTRCSMLARVEVV